MDKKHQGIINSIKWGFIVLLLVLIVLGNYYFREVALALRTIGISAAAVLTTILAVWTTQGARFLLFLKASQAEIKKVVWPSRQETFYTTIIVVVFSTIMSLLLWGVDGLLVRAVAWITEWRW